MKIILRKQIHSCFAAMSSNDAFLQLEYSLPKGLQPFVGLSISDSYIDANRDISLTVELDEVIKEIYIYKGKLFCAVESDKTFYDIKKAFCSMTAEDKIKFDELVESYVKKGWKVT